MAAPTSYPRPWRVEEDPFGFAVYAADYDLVCLTGDENHLPGDREAAELLAAAPELAEALRDHLRLQREGCRCNDEKRYVCASCRAEKVLRRIDGGAA
ncbi:hypothetical protein [Vulgatibacter sp.]|uniref:hypothetical protein n=1 Tax=Vulgatibacter sp. TaxID=1971226 RepID=UPI003561E152